MQYNDISVMTAKEYCIAFCEGYFCAQLGEKLTNGKVTEHTLDLAKRLRPVWSNGSPILVLMKSKSRR